MRSSSLAGLLCAALLLVAGCGKAHCEKLLEIACDHVSDEEDATFQCEKLREQAESFSDEQCAENLKLLKESGKLQNQR